MKWFENTDTMKKYKSFIVTEGKIDTNTLNKLNKLATQYSGFKTAKEFTQLYTEIDKLGLTLDPCYGTGKTFPNDPDTHRWDNIAVRNENDEVVAHYTYYVYEGNPNKKEYNIYFYK